MQILDATENLRASLKRLHKPELAAQCGVPEEDLKRFMDGGHLSDEHKIAVTATLFPHLVYDPSPRSLREQDRDLCHPAGHHAPSPPRAGLHRQERLSPQDEDQLQPPRSIHVRREGPLTGRETKTVRRTRRSPGLRPQIRLADPAAGDKLPVHHAPGCCRPPVARAASPHD